MNKNPLAAEKHWVMETAKLTNLHLLSMSSLQNGSQKIRCPGGEVLLLFSWETESHRFFQN